MPEYPWCSRFDYGSGGDAASWTTSLPARPWDRKTPTIGGAKTSGAGIPASYVVRRDYVLMLSLRVLETEWANLEAMIAWGQTAETFLWYPDANDPYTSFDVWLESPQAGAPLTPSRDSDYPLVLTVNIELRRADGGGPWTLDYFPLDEEEGS